jgi:acetyl-CoA acetyltransferase
MNRAIITRGVRTPIGRYIGSMWDVPADKLGAGVLNELVRRAAAAPLVKAVVLGQFLPERQLPAWLCWRRAGL